MLNDHSSLPNMDTFQPQCTEIPLIKNIATIPDNESLEMPETLEPPEETNFLFLSFEGAKQSFQIQQWTTENYSKIDMLLKKHSAILLRNLPVETAADFNSFTQATNLDLMSYEGGTAPRKQVEDNVFTASDDPPEVAIEPHNEMSYVAKFPTKLMFYCQTEPEAGGETPIGCVHKLTALLDREVKDKFKRFGIKYRRHLPDQNEGFLSSWQSVFFTDDKLKVNRQLEDWKYDFSWNDGNGLTYSYTRPAFQVHSSTQKDVWFNQTTLHGTWTHYHPDYTPYNLPFDKLPTHCFYGNGEEIESETLSHVRSCLWKSSTAFTWRKNDILILDNLSALHGRLPYTGPRKVLASLFS